MDKNQDAADNLSDFDNSDEDLGSLLGDDDDDIFSKKVFGDAPTKQSATQKTSTLKKKAEESEISPTVTTEQPAKLTNKSRKISFNDDLDDILDNFIDSDANKNTNKALKLSTKSNSKETETPIDLNQFSPSKEFSSVSKGQESKIITEDVDKTSFAAKSSQGRRESYFDEFLQGLSPKKSANSILRNAEVKSKSIEDPEEDILGTYIPTAPKKNAPGITPVKTSPKRKGSLFKEVSFKEEIDDDFEDGELPYEEGELLEEDGELPEEDEELPDEPRSPIKPSSRKHSLSAPVAKTSVASKDIKRSSKGKVDDDIDWLNFFNDNRKGTETRKKRDVTTAVKKDIQFENKPKSPLVRKSSADWLGLKDTEPENILLEDKESKTQSLENAFQSKVPNLSSTHHRDKSLKELDNWGNSSNFIVERNTSGISDLSEILKNTNVSSESMPFTSQRRSTDKNMPGLSPKKHPTQEVPKMQSLPSQFDNVPSKNPLRDSVLAPSFSIPPSKDLHSQSIEQSTVVHSMQKMIDNYIREQEKLLKQNENLKQTYEEKIKALDELYRAEKNSKEELNKTLESSFKEEFNIKIKALENKLSLLSEEKETEKRILREKLESVQKEHQFEIQRLKELHSHAVTSMKEDHEEALSRLKQLKNQEVEAVLSTQAHSKSLQHLSDQLEARANEIATLQNKAEERNQSTWREKQALLDAKEKSLKALENRLQKQLENNDEENTRLQQLVLRLESRLQKLTMEGEEDHWEAQQMKAKLKVQQQYMEEEYKLNLHQIEKEKEKLRLSQDSMLHEQKTVLLQLAQERQLFVQEKAELQSLAKHVKEEEAKLNVMKVKVESEIKSQKQFLEEEANQLHFEKEKVKQEYHQLEREKDSLQREKQQVRNEKEKLREWEMQLQRKATEVEDLAAAVTREQEKGRRDHAEAINAKSEQQLKMQQYTQQMHALLEKERQILQEKEKLMAEKLEFEQNKQSAMCTRCKLSIENVLQTSHTELSTPALIGSQNALSTNTQVHQSFVDPNLVIWHLAAQKDREFLQQELSFLQSLKDSTKTHK